jgi:hypothetical protein
MPDQESPEQTVQLDGSHFSGIKIHDFTGLNRGKW